MITTEALAAVRQLLEESGEPPENWGKVLDAEASRLAPRSSSFTLTEDQSEAVDGILDAIHSGARSVLCGYAGTGKTVTTAALVTRLVDRGMSTIVATPTHKARAQVERALRGWGASGFSVVTVARLLSLRMGRDYNTGKETFKPDPKGENMLSDPDAIDVVIIDETSMLSRDLYDLLLQELGGRPVVFVGDDRQLLPVGEDEVCRAFVESDHLFRLTKVLRHDGAILNLATATRELPVGRAPFASASGGESRVIAHHSREAWLNELIELASTNEAMEDADFCRALAWTNNAVEEMNKRIHRRRYGSYAPQFVEGMTCVTVDAIPSPLGGTPLLNSTVDILVEKAERQQHKFRGDLPADALWDTWELTVSIAGETAQRVAFRVIAEGEAKRWSESQREIATMAKNASGRERSELWELYYERKDAVGVVQPASALTIHKSQGSTFRNVFLHWSIDGYGSAPTAQQNQLAYVGITRAAESLHVVRDR
jgi:exodeoxyribonuclease-5